MAKGFFKGVSWGAGVSVGALVLISVADNRNDGLGERSSASVTSQQSQSASLTDDDGLSGVGLGGPEVAAPEPDTLAGLLSDTLAPAAVPQAGSASNLGGAEAPADGALTGIASPSTDAPQVTYTDTGTLKTPATEPGVSIATEPAQPVAPDPVPQTSAFAEPEQPVAPEAQDGSANTASPDSPRSAWLINCLRVMAPATSGMTT